MPDPTVPVAATAPPTATSAPASASSSAPSTGRVVGRWLLGFAGFPLGGLLTDLAVGPVDSAASAVLGGLLTGGVLGAVQSWALGARRPSPARWVAATAAGLTVGLLAGGSATGYGTALPDLLLLGAACGAAVGALQAAVLAPLLGRAAAVWPFALALLWAGGWAVTASVGVQVEEQFSVFGSSGAVTVTALTAVLPVLLHRTAHRRISSRSAS